MKSSPRKSLDTCITQIPDLDSPLILELSTSESYYEKYISLKEKYIKLYKEHNLLLKTCDLNSNETKDEELLKMLNQKITDQQKEILWLRTKVDQLNSKVEKVKNSRRMSVGAECERKAEGNRSEVSADVCLIGLLIHRLILGQRFSKDELLKYRLALYRIEEKFAESPKKDCKPYRARTYIDEFNI